MRPFHIKQEMSMKGPWFTAIAAALVVVPVVLADKWAPPSPETYRKGDVEFRTDPGEGFKGPAMAILVRLSKEGDKEIWKGKLVNVPYKAQVEADGKHVLTFDTYANLGYDHAIVVYGEKGKVLADLKLDDFLTKDEITKHAPATVSSRRWFSEKHKFTIKDKQLDVQLDWGKKFSVSLETGKVLPEK
jgi:hypothetical protein